MYWIKILQAIIAVMLIVVILLQNRGAGSSGLFGGVGGGTYSVKRGMEKILFYATIILSTLLILISLAIIVM
jgi:preprotein translocase subunit SecG